MKKLTKTQEKLWAELILIWEKIDFLNKKNEKRLEEYEEYRDFNALDCMSLIDELLVLTQVKLDELQAQANDLETSIRIHHKDLTDEEYYWLWKELIWF